MSASRLVGIVDYGAGNLRSLKNAFDYLGARVIRLHSHADFLGCTHVVLPGVGAFGFCAQRLRQSGMIEPLRDWALSEQRPLLGICVGMQLMAGSSEEQPDEQGLDWIGGQVRRLPANIAGVRVPHVGWNRVEFSEPFGDFVPGSGADFYFDHSYAYHNPDKGRASARCLHGVEFCAILRRDNITAAQFHPEKSQSAGMRFLRGFLTA